MTSSAKSGITINVSELNDGPTYYVNADDVKVPLNELLAHLKKGLVGISAADTHLKPLYDAIAVGTGLAKAISSAGADESLSVTVDSKLVALLAFLTAAGKLSYTGMDATGITSGYVLTANGSGAATWASSGAGTTPMDVTGTAGETLAQRDAVYLASDNTWYKIDTDATAAVKAGVMRGFVTQSGGIASGSTGTIRITGEVSGFSSLTAWGEVYASTTAGGYTQTRPAVTDGGGQIALVRLGIATSTTTIWCYPYPVYFVKRETLGNGDTLTIEHYSDPADRRRVPMAYLNGTGEGQKMVSVAGSGQNLSLRRQEVATYTADQCTGGTASASSEYGTSYASKAFDDNVATYWRTASSVTVGATIEYEFASAKVIRRYSLRARSNGLTTSLTAWNLQYYDGASWLNAHQRTLGAVVNYESATTNNVTGYYSSTRWRIQVVSVNGGSYAELAEIEMFEAATYTTNDKLAQSFQVATGGTVDIVTLGLTITGSPTGTLTVRVETDSSGSPSGTLVDANATISVGESALVSSYNTLDFTTNFTLSASTTYWLVISTDRAASPGNDYIAWQASSSSVYASGELKAEQSSSWTALSCDANFSFTSTASIVETGATLGQWDDGTRDLGLRFGDENGANRDTKTTVKNVFGTSLDVTLMVRLD